MYIRVRAYLPHVAFSLLVMISSFGAQAETLEVAFTAPVTCAGDHPAASCGTPVSLGKVEASAAILARDLATCQTDPGQCGALKLPKRQAAPSFACGGQFLVDDEWLPSSVDEIKRLYGDALKGIPVNNRIVVQASDTPANERHFASCSVRTVDGRHGPPRRCVTIAVEFDGKVYRRTGGVDGISNDEPFIFCNAVSMTSPSGRIAIEFEIVTTKDIGTFADALHALLTNEFALAVRRRAPTTGSSDIDITSTSGLRESTILPPFREALDLDISIGQMGKNILLNASTNPLICRTNSAKLSEYRGLDDGERNAYAGAFNKRIKETIIATCGQVTSADDKTIVCQ